MNSEKFALHKKIQDCCTSCRFPEALKYCEESLKKARETEDKIWEMQAYCNFADVLYLLSRFHESIEYFRKCLVIANDIQDKKEIARVHDNLANALQKIGKSEESIKHCKELLKIANDSSDKKGQQQAYLRFGNAYKSLGKYKTSMDYFNSCLEIAKEIGDKLMQGRAYGNMGVLFKAQGNYREAIKNEEKCRDIAIEMGNLQSEANAYGNLGIAYRLLSKYCQAIQYHEKSINIFRNIGDKKGEGNEIGNMGNAYKALGNCQKAIACYKEGLDIAKKIKSKDGELNAFGQLGSVYQLIGECKKANECNDQCLEIAKQIGDKNSEAKAYGQLGAGYEGSGEYDKAIKYYQKFFNIVKEIGDRNGQMAALGNLGNVYCLSGMYEKSIDSTQKCLDLAKEMDDICGQAKACFTFGQCYYVLSYKQNGERDQYDLLRESEKYLKESLRNYEWSFDHLEKGQDQLKISIVDTFIHAYKLLTTVYIKMQQNEAALLTCDRGRARALSDLLATKYEMEMDTGPRGRLEYSDVKRIMSTPSSCILFFGIVMRPHKTIDNDIIEGGVATWLITHDNPLFMTHDIEFDKFEFSSQKPANEYVNNLVNHAFTEMEVRRTVDCEDRSLGTNLDIRYIEDVKYDGESALEKLFDMFVSPIQDKLATQDEIIIIPDGGLFTVPFAALKDSKTKSYFFKDKRIRLAPSLTTLKILKESSADSQRTTGALIVGDPEVGKVMFQDGEHYFGRLPGAKSEAEMIAEMLDENAITGSQATKQFIKQRLQEEVAVVHFAAHGSTEGEIALTPNASAVEGSIPQEKDYLLTMKEVQEIGIKAHLVVLSCCHSGRGEIKAEGVIGISRAFLAAGARAVVGSLWAIADQATMEFMKRFYTHLKERESASSSLLKAMQDMRNIQGYEDPRFWAPFFLIGDDVTIF